MTPENQDDFTYIVETTKTFDEAVVSVIKTVEQKGWSLFQVYDIKERLAAKEFTQRPLKIIELCNGKYANYFLNQNQLVSLCMPCRINVFEDENSNIKIATMKPTTMTRFFPEIEIEKAIEIEKDIIEIVDNSK